MQHVVSAVCYTHFTGQSAVHIGSAFDTKMDNGGVSGSVTQALKIWINAMPYANNKWVACNGNKTVFRLDALA